MPSAPLPVAPSAPPRMTPQQLRLLARIHRRYQTITQTVEINSLSLAFTRIADPDRVLDEVADQVDRQERRDGHREAEPLHLPYWAELWDSAAGVARFLVEQWAGRDRAVGVPPVPGVLDLGCGMGLSGTVAAALGARVLFADLEAPALLFARLNSLPYRPRVRTRRLNWQRDRLAERFDLILGADILYERPQWDYLEPFWQAHLAVGGSVLLGEPGRPSGDAFEGWITSRRWVVERFDVPVSTRPRPIRLFRIRPA